MRNNNLKFKAMGKLKQGILGQVTGKVGNVVGAKWMNLNTIRGYQPDVHNPNTKPQMYQRSKFSTIVKLVRQVLPLINYAYDGSLEKMSPFNKVTSINTKNAFINDPPILDHTKVVLCDNVGSMVSNVTMNADINQVMNITWEPNSTNADELAYLLTFVLFNIDTNEAIIYKEVAARADGSASVTAPLSWVGSMTALHILATDYVSPGGLIPRRVVKFKAGSDLASKVK
jgi:hypothetical protein